MQENIYTQTSPASDWDAVEPLLNAALSALKPADRDAILLRFLEGYTLTETGSLFGIIEDAARMRCARALEKLRRYQIRKDTPPLNPRCLSGVFFRSQAV